VEIATVALIAFSSTFRSAPILRGLFQRVILVAYSTLRLVACTETSASFLKLCHLVVSLKARMSGCRKLVVYGRCTETFCLLCTYLISRFCRNFFPRNANVVNSGEGKCDQGLRFLKCTSTN